MKKIQTVLLLGGTWHDGQVWNLPPYRLLLAQAASWVLGSKS